MGTTFIALSKFDPNLATDDETNPKIDLTDPLHQMIIDWVRTPAIMDYINVMMDDTRVVDDLTLVSTTEAAQITKSIEPFYKYVMDNYQSQSTTPQQRQSQQMDGSNGNTSNNKTTTSKTMDKGKKKKKKLPPPLIPKADVVADVKVGVGPEDGEGNDKDNDSTHGVD